MIGATISITKEPILGTIPTNAAEWSALDWEPASSLDLYVGPASEGQRTNHGGLFWVQVEKGSPDTPEMRRCLVGPPGIYGLRMRIPVGDASPDFFVPVWPDGVEAGIDHFIRCRFKLAGNTLEAKPH